mgnify:CR=1 FL=1
MSEATRYTIFFVLSFVTFTAWGMITHDLRGTVWYWAAGILLAGLSEVWFRQVKKISEEKARPLGFFRFGPMMICLIVLSLNLLGDGLRDAMDPKLKN